MIVFVFTGMDEHMHTDLILVDLQKAFDTLDYRVLIEKMNYFGFRTSVINWFESKQKQKISQTEHFWLVLIMFF